MREIFIAYLALINMIAFWSMWSDKRKAIKGKYRIPEKTLFLFALLGGSLGSVIGMQKFRHKTKHWYFKYGMPLILIIQLILLVVFCVTTPEQIVNTFAQIKEILPMQ